MSLGSGNHIPCFTYPPNRGISCLFLSRFKPRTFQGYIFGMNYVLHVTQASGVNRTYGVKRNVSKTIGFRRQILSHSRNDRPSETVPDQPHVFTGSDKLFYLMLNRQNKRSTSTRANSTRYFCYISCYRNSGRITHYNRSNTALFG